MASIKLKHRSHYSSGTLHWLTTFGIANINPFYVFNGQVFFKNPILNFIIKNNSLKQTFMNNLFPVSAFLSKKI